MLRPRFFGAFAIARIRAAPSRRNKMPTVAGRPQCGAVHQSRTLARGRCALNGPGRMRFIHRLSTTRQTAVALAENAVVHKLHTEMSPERRWTLIIKVNQLTVCAAPVAPEVNSKNIGPPQILSLTDRREIRQVVWADQNATRYSGAGQGDRPDHANPPQARHLWPSWPRMRSRSQSKHPEGRRTGRKRTPARQTDDTKTTG